MIVVTVASESVQTSASRRSSPPKFSEWIDEMTTGIRASAAAHAREHRARIVESRDGDGLDRGHAPEEPAEDRKGRARRDTFRYVTGMPRSSSLTP